MMGADRETRGRAPSRSCGLLTLAVLAVAAIASPCAEAAVATIGTVFSGYLPFAGQEIPLPQCQWVLIGDGYQIASGAEGAPGHAIEDVVLFKQAKDAVPAFIIAHRNLVSRGDGWGIAPDCDRDDILAKVNWDDADSHGFCGFVNHVQTAVTTESAESWKQATAYAGQWNLKLPSTWLMAGDRPSAPHHRLH